MLGRARRVACIMVVIVGMMGVQAYASGGEVILSINNAYGDYYASQFESSNMPRFSCMSAVAKMIINICSDSDNVYRRDSVTDISKYLNTTSNGAYSEDVVTYLKGGGIHNRVVLYTKSDKRAGVSNIVDGVMDGYVFMTIVDTGKLKVSGHDFRDPHGVLVVGLRVYRDDIKVVIVDPYIGDREVEVSIFEFLNSLTDGSLFGFRVNGNRDIVYWGK